MNLRTFLPAICLMAAFFLSACDQIYGVQRTARLMTAPEVGCTARAINTTEGVKLAWENKQTDTGAEITMTGLHANGPVESYAFRGTTSSPVEGVVQYEFNWRGYVDFSDTDLRLNARPTQPEIDATRHVMREIEAHIAEKCDLPVLRSSVSEMCIGVSCKPF